jgi:hypothetical protein
MCHYHRKYNKGLALKLAALKLKGFLVFPSSSRSFRSTLDIDVGTARLVSADDICPHLSGKVPSTSDSLLYLLTYCLLLAHYGRQCFVTVRYFKAEE